MISYLCYNSEIFGNGVKLMQLFILVCCHALNVVFVLFFRFQKYPNNALHGSDASCVLFTVSWWGGDQPIKCRTSFLLVTFFLFWIRVSWNFTMVVCVLVVPCFCLVVIEAQHAFHLQSHCVNYKHQRRIEKKTLHFITEGFHCVNTGFCCASRWTAWLESLTLWRL